MEIWCPYTNQFISELDSNEEHIIPLSLGGNNSFTIKVSSDANSRRASMLDAQFGKLGIVSSARKYFKLKGHSKEEPQVRWPVSIQGMKGTLDLSKDSHVFIARRSHNPYGLNIDKNLTEKTEVRASLDFDANMMLSFACKVALGSGKYLFPKAFREYGQHDHLRLLMNSENSIADLKHLVSFGSTRFWALPWPQSLRAPDKIEPWFKLIQRRKEKHVIFTLHTTSEIILGISLFSGLYPFYFQLSGFPEKFPIGGNFELGAVMEFDLPSKSFKRENLRDYLVILSNDLNDLQKIRVGHRLRRCPSIKPLASKTRVIFRG